VRTLASKRAGSWARQKAGRLRGDGHVISLQPRRQPSVVVGGGHFRRGVGPRALELPLPSASTKTAPRMPGHVFLQEGVREQLLQPGMFDFELLETLRVGDSRAAELAAPQVVAGLRESALRRSFTGSSAFASRREVLPKKRPHRRGARLCGRSTRTLSERRALQVVHVSATALRLPRPDPNPSLRDRILALAHRHRRYGAGIGSSTTATSSPFAATPTACRSTPSSGATVRSLDRVRADRPLQMAW
jgi:hypothetical protein